MGKRYIKKETALPNSPKKVKNRTLPMIALVLMVSILAFLSYGCKKEDGNKEPEQTPSAKPTATVGSDESKDGKDAKDEADDGIIRVEVDNSTTYQTIEGFGGSFAWYSQWLTMNEHKDEIYDLLFKDAKMTILRFKNRYKYDMENDINLDTELEIYKEAKKRMKEYGQEPTVLMSSWSPSADLKSNDVTYGSGTLKKNKKGEYVYDKFGQYWYELVKEYRDYGIPIDIISIQNECDFTASYDGCEFNILESENLASYAKAYLATYRALQKMKNPPKMIGPETMTIASMTIKMYMEDVFREAPESVYGIAHHLYNGGSHTDPGSFVMNMRELNEYYPNLSKWQTEFFRGDLIQTVQLIQNSMLFENLNAYLFWGSVWHAAEDSQSLIKLDPTVNPEQFTYDKGYGVMEHYYAMRHFSEFVLPGYLRVGTKISKDNNYKLSCSAYVDEKQDNMVMVAINATKEEQTFEFQMKDYNLESSKMILSDCSGSYETEDLYKEAGALPDDKRVTLPANSIVTIVCTGNANVETTSGISSNTSDGGNVESQFAEIAKGANVTAKADDAEWNDAEPIEMTQVAYGDHGASGSFQALWKDDRLCVRVEVKDDTMDTSGNNYSNKDSIEIFVNESNSKGATYGLGDKQIVINRDGELEFAIGALEEEIAYEVTGDGKGYVLALEIPFKSITPEAGNRIGFDVQINDATGGTNSYILKWSDSSRYTYENLSKIGSLELK